MGIHVEWYDAWSHDCGIRDGMVEKQKQLWKTECQRSYYPAEKGYSQISTSKGSPAEITFHQIVLLAVTKFCLKIRGF